jgi:pyridoxine/pyridoxamine 5'-phosphate oxidase
VPEAGYPAKVDRSSLASFVRQRGLAVLASTNDLGEPQAALVGVTATDRAEIVFDTVASSRKYANFTRNRRVALVIGWDDEQTVQLEGMAEEIQDPAEDPGVAAYFEQYPDGRERATWPGITYIRVTPVWARYSDHRTDPPSVEEIQLT